MPSGPGRFAMFCRTMVTLAPRDQRLYAYVGSEMLRSAIASLASEVRVLPGVWGKGGCVLQPLTMHLQRPSVLAPGPQLAGVASGGCGA